MAFQFKLEAVRRLRQFEEEQKQQELSDAERILKQEKSVLENHMALRTRTEEDFRHRSAQGDLVPQAVMYRSFLQRLADDIDSQRGKVESALKVCDEKRQALLEAMKKRKALDRLKQKGEQAFLAELNSEEEKFINEMAINRFSLKQR